MQNNVEKVFEIKKIMYLCTDYHFNKLKNNTKMKKVQTLMLMLLVAVMGMTVQSCSKEETKTISGETDYFRKPLTDLNYKGKKVTDYTAQEVAGDEVLGAFAVALSSADASMGSLSYGSDATVMKIYQNAMADFTYGKGFEGYILITKRDSGGSETEVGRVSFTK